MSGRALYAAPDVIESAPLRNVDGSETVLLLRNGGTLQGQVSRADGRYTVSDERSTFDVAEAQVAMTCRSIDEAYVKQREQLASDAEAHLKLAEWCLRSGLLPQAAQQLADAEKVDPHAPMTSILKRRLDVLMRPKSDRPATEPAASREVEKTEKKLDKNEALAEGLPPGALEKFTRKIQPLLVNNCTTSGCHQSSSAQTFQLNRAMLHGMSNRRTTLANLSAAVALIDRSNPQHSRLLEIPGDIHAGMQQPIFGPRQKEQTRQLSEWIALVTGTQATDSDNADSNPALAVAIAAPPGDHGQSAKPRGRTIRGMKPHRYEPDVLIKPVEQAADRDSDPSGVQQASFETEVRSVMPRQPLRTGARVDCWQPKDAFDPELFNRQSQQQASAAAGH